MNVAFGTPLEMYDLVTADELARWDASRNILAVDSSITELVRERLVDVLLPYARRLRIPRRSAVADHLPLAA
ncbi:hypothetical protein [Streptomyces bacillaris]|uniref:hypothetical protein n=1 Tax=Streptomyces bacillaris TaxID=68179 RepID=UPI0034616617